MAKLDETFLFLLLLLQVNFFDLINTKNNFLGILNGYNQKNLISFLVVIYLIIFILKGRNNIQNNEIIKRNFNAFVLSFELVILITLFFSSFVYNQSIVDTFINSFYFIILFLYFIYSSYFSNWLRWIRVIKMFSVFSFILSITKLIQSFCVMNYGIQILKLNNDVDYDTALSGNYVILNFTRIPSACDFVFFSTFLLIVTITINKSFFNRWFSIIILTTNIMYIILVGQTRLYIAMISLMVGLYVVNVVNNKYGSFGIFATIFIFLLLLYKIVGKIIYYFMYGNELRAKSAFMRFYEMNYYLELFKNNPWIGLGFPDSKDYGFLLHGGNFSYYLDDVGIIGYIGRFGIIGCIPLFIFICTYIKQGLRINNIFVFLMFIVYIVGSFISLSLFDEPRIFYLPFLLLFLDFLGSKVSKIRN